MNAIRRTLGSRHSNPILFALIAIIIYLWGKGSPALLNTGVSVITFSLIAVPLGLMWGHGKMISVCQASFAAVGGYCSAHLTINYGWSPWLSLAPAILLPALIAYILSRRILRLPELALALSTVAIGQVWGTFSGLANNLTGGYEGVFGLPRLPFGETEAGTYIGGAVALGVLIVLHENYTRSARGRALRAIKVDPILAQSVGSNVASQRSIVFSMAAGAAGFAGWYYAHNVGFLAPDSLSFTQSLAVLFMVVIGGRSSSLGPVIGAVIYIIASDHLPGGQIQGVYFGGMLVLALLLLPDGLLSIPSLLRRRKFGRVHQPVSEAESDPFTRVEAKSELESGAPS